MAFIDCKQVQKKVLALSAIIRIAVAFERSNFSAIQQVDVKYAREKYIIVSAYLVIPTIFIFSGVIFS